VEPAPGEFVYFRNQFYGEGQRNWAYYSRNPRYFGIDDDSGLVANFPIGAPEIVYHEGKYYVVSLKPTLNGMQVARLKFYRRGALGDPVFDVADAGVRNAWRVTQGSFPVLFTDKPHAPFNSPAPFNIGTAETPDGGFDDAYTGTIESPTFILESAHYYVLVSGGFLPDTGYVSLVDDVTGEVLAKWTGNSTNSLARIPFASSQWTGRTVRLRIVDNATGPWGHINFGGIYREGPRTLIK
jgi:hypothetical protein